jgi:small subunit ribosomal protein S18
MAANTRRPRRASALPDVTPIRRNRLAALALTAARYMDTAAPRTPLSERDTIRARTATGLTVHQQRHVTRAITNARDMALLPQPGQRPGDDPATAHDINARRGDSGLLDAPATRRLPDDARRQP